MKAFNIVLSIFILLLAVVLAASSYFLYEKREIMLDGWNKMAGAINQTAAALDKGSGTENAKELTQDTLAHANYENLETELPKIVSATETIVKQRDAAANALRDIASEQEMQNVPAAKNYTELATFEASKNATVANAKEFRRNRDNVIGAVVKSASIVNVSLNRDELKRGNTGVFAAFDGKIREVLDIMGACQENSRSIAGLTGAAYPDFAPAKYKSSLEAIRVSVSDLKSRYETALRDIAQKNQDIAGLKDTVKARETTISEREKDIATRDARIEQLKKTLGLGDGNMPDPWENGSLASRKAMRGEVIELNPKYGFFVVSVGRNTRVKQPIGNKINEVDPKLEVGMNLRIARNADSPDVEFVRRVKITNVLDDCSIVESVDGDKPIKVGDSVYLITGDDPAASVQAAK